MNKLEVGMYARNKIGIIGKIISIQKDNQDRDIITIYNGKFHIIHNENQHEFDITKASHNIIDLIEVGDYVNGVLIESIYSREEDKIHFHTFAGEIMIEITNKNINNIVTKEQFKSMTYRLGE